MRAGLVLIFFPLVLIQTVLAGGSIGWDEVKSRISKSDPELVEVIERSFVVNKSGGALRLGPSFGERWGDRIAPYEFEADDRKTNLKCVLVIEESEDKEFTGRFKFTQRWEQSKNPIAPAADTPPTSTSNLPAGVPIQGSRSPLLTTDFLEGVWIPGTYGGVSGVVLDLAKIGTDNMLNVRFRGESELRPLDGAKYKLHSDKTAENGEQGTKVRTVILIDDSPAGNSGYKSVICYKITTYQDVFDKQGVRLTSASTLCQLSMSGVANDYEVLYLITFASSFPNSEHPGLTQPPNKERSPEPAASKKEAK